MYQVTRSTAYALIAASMLSVLWPGVTIASTIYTMVPVTYSTGYTMSGTITTSGATGLLTLADILSWNLSATNGVSTYQVEPTQKTMTATNSLYAIATTLSLHALPQQPNTDSFADFNLGNFLHATDIYQGWATTSYSASTNTLQHYKNQVYSFDFLTPYSGGNNSVDSDAPLPDILIAQSVTAQSVPEPATFILAGLGLLGLGCVALQKKFRRA